MKDKTAVWKNRSYRNDHSYAECSNCGFTELNYKVVEIGMSSDDYVAVKWDFCPSCGSNMHIVDREGGLVKRM